MAADTLSMDNVGKRYDVFHGWGMVTGKVKVLVWTEVQKPSL